MENLFADIFHTVYIDVVFGASVSVCTGVRVCVVFKARCSIVSPWSYAISGSCSLFIDGHAKHVWVNNQRDKKMTMQNNANITLVKPNCCKINEQV